MQGLHKFRSLIVPTVFAGVIAAVVSTWHNAGLEPQARAEPRRITPQEPDQHFKSGGRLSEAVLQEMLVVLKRIDERLERMERSVDQLAGSGRGATTNTVVEQRPLPGAAPIQVRRNR